MKKIKNKKIIFTLIFIFTIGGTIAYLSTTDVFENIFVVGAYRIVSTEVFESPDNWKPGDETPKTITVKNEGTVPVKIRLSYTEEWKDENGNNLPLTYNNERLAIINFDNGQDYAYRDGYYYYDYDLQPGEETSSFIKSVTFNPSYEGSISCESTNDGKTNTCESNDDSYDGGTYKLTINIEGIQSKYYVQAWNLQEEIYNNTTYNILRKEIENNGLSKEYTGSHKDSTNPALSTKPIYYWYASNNATGAQVQNKNNIIFAEQCWQIIRTTDTGGVKLIYNGVPTISTVNDEKTYSCDNSRPGRIGYQKVSMSLDGYYYYSASYEPIVDNLTTTYRLIDPIQISVNNSNATTSIANIAANYPYTCKSNYSTNTCTTMYKVDSQNSGTYAYLYHSTSRESIDINTYNNTLSIADVGFMNNNRWTDERTSITLTKTIYEKDTLSSSKISVYGNYYFGDSYTMSGNLHALTNPLKGNTIADYPLNWVGKYMCESNSSSTCNSIYYIAGIDTSGTNPILYRAKIEIGKEYNDPSYKYLFGDTIKDNGDGTIEIVGNIEEINKNDWANVYSTIVNKFICMPGYYTYDANNNKYICNDSGTQNVGALNYIGETTISNFRASAVYKYGYGITANGNNYKITSNNNEDGTLQYVSKWPDTSTSNCFTTPGETISNCGYKAISKSHYTCYNLTGECSNYHYINYTSKDDAYSTSITGGKYVSTDLTDHNNILYLMLYQNDENGNVNTNNSRIKSTIDSWYQSTLLENYDKYIEDTIYCNDRTITNFGGWNPNGGETHTNYQLEFSDSNSTDLSCNNITDRFSISNNDAKLTYKVGLITVPEINLLNNNNARKTGSEYWLGTPGCFNTSPNTFYIDKHGNKFIKEHNFYNGIRPVITLKPEVKFISGTGTMADPYIVDTTH